MKKQKQQKPLVSVVMPVYNAGDFVVEAIESILRQSYENWELIIVDDASTDGSLRIAKNYAKRDKRIRVYELKENVGPAKASVVGVRMARGKYLAKMDADDISPKDRLEKQVRFLEDNPDVAMLGGQCVLIDGEGVEVGEKRFPLSDKEVREALFWMNPMQHPATILNLKLIPKKVLLSTDEKSVLAHDLELVFMVGKYGKVVNLDEVVLFYRVRGDSFSLKNPKETFRHTLKVRLKGVLRYGYIPSLKGVILSLGELVLVELLSAEMVRKLWYWLRSGKYREVWSGKVLRRLGYQV